MRKIFFFFAAMLVAVAMNAATSVNPGTNTLHAALHDAPAGDTLILADGTYIENANGSDGYITFQKDVVVMAAENAQPVIEMYVPAIIKSGALAEVKGLKFDAAHLYQANWYTHILYADDAGNNRLIFDGCEFYNDTVNDASIYCSSSTKIDSLVIKNCYFHDIYKSALWLHNADAKVKILNSTFSNIEPLAANDDYWCAPIYMDAATGNLEVDHCTFYNVKMMSDGYGSITVDNFTDAAITNSVFMFPSSEDRCIAKLPAGANVRNCVAYNYDNWQPFSWADKATIVACTKGDPKFADAANDDFTLSTASAALDYAGKAADATTDITLDLGAEKWIPAKRVFYCDITATGSNWWGETGAVGCYAKVDGGAALPWPGIRMTEVSTGVWRGEISVKYNKMNFTRMNPSDEGNQYWGAKTDELDIPSDKDYYKITSSDKTWDPATLTGKWYVKDAKFYIAGSMTDWESNMIPSMEDSYTLSLAAGNHQLKVVDNDSWKGIGNLTAITGGLYIDQTNNICFTLAAAGDVTVTYVSGETFTVVGDFAAPVVKLIGEQTEFGHWVEADAVVLTPAEDKKSASVTKSLSEWWYDFKVIRAGEWLGKVNEGEGNYKIHKDYNWVDALVRDYEGLKCVSLQPSEVDKEYIFTWNYAEGKLTVTFPSVPSAITNTEAELKAVKRLVNGQLIIEKNGVRYNVLGTVVR